MASPAKTEIDDLDIETSLLTFGENVLGYSLYDWQCDTIEPFDHISESLQLVTLATPNGSGKSSIVIPTIALGILALYPQSKVVITTADSKQLDNQIMPSINAHRAKFPDWKFIEREITTPTGGRLVAFTTDEPGRAEGWHKLDDTQGPLVVICDEAKSIPEKIFDAIDRCTFNGLLLTSSPGRMSGTFYESQTNTEHGFVRVSVGLKDCPHIGQDKIDRIIAKHGASSAFTRSALHGEFLESFEGKPVYYAYNQDVHEGDDLPWPTGAYLWRGHDVGTHAATTWSAYWVENGIEYWHDLFEFYQDGFDTDRHAREVLRITEAEFPFWNNRLICAGVSDAIDPAAANSSFTRQINVNGKSVAESALNIFRTYGINPVYRTKSRGLIETIGVVNRLFEKRDPAGRPCFRVDRMGCPKLVRGYRGGYRWPTAEEKGAQSDVPVKGLACDNLDHPQDGARYSKINALRLLNAEIQKAAAPVPWRAKRANINVAR